MATAPAITRIQDDIERGRGLLANPGDQSASVMRPSTDAPSERPPVGVATLVLSLGFALSVVGKLLGPAPTLAVLTDLWGLPPIAARVAFVALIVVESALALGLVLSRRTVLVHALSTAFLLAVSVSVVRQLAEGSSLGCGCGLPTGGLSPQAGAWLALSKNTALVALAGIAVVRRHPPGAARSPGRSLP